MWGIKIRLIEHLALYPVFYMMKKKGLSQKSAFTFLDSPKWENIAKIKPIVGINGRFNTQNGP
jgi:hypothetical protein